MIREVETRNFRNLRDGVFRITSPMLVAGPNNSGKTSLLRAIALWAELMTRWIEGVGDPVREDDGNYPLLQTQLANIASIPLANGDHLWAEKKVEESIRIALRTDEWRIALEIVHHHSEFLGFHPAADVEERDLELAASRPIRPIFLSVASGLDVREPWLNLRAIPGYLALGQGGSILRNLLREVSEDEDKWALLTERIRRSLGVELLQPRAGPRTVRAWYRETAGGPIYELECAGSGMVQILLIQAALLHFEGTVLLLDEPDAHLHPWLVEVAERALRQFARDGGAQLIAATHSPHLIRAAEPRNLSVMVDGRLVAGDGDGGAPFAEQVVERLDPEDIALAPAASGILYVEGRTDIEILRAWAERLDHPALRFLKRPFWKQCALGRRFGPPQHYRLLRGLLSSDLPGVVLRDGDGKTHKESGRRNGLRRLFWKRYEIENYLLHPPAVVRFVTVEEPTIAKETADGFIRDQLLPSVYRSPLKDHEYHRRMKGKTVLSNAFARMDRPPSQGQYWRIAAVMTPEEIHPEVVEKLDAIAEWFGLTGEEAGPAVSGR